MYVKGRAILGHESASYKKILVAVSTDNLPIHKIAGDQATVRARARDALFKFKKLLLAAEIELPSKLKSFARYVVSTFL